MVRLTIALALIYQDYNMSQYILYGMEVDYLLIYGLKQYKNERNMGNYYDLYLAVCIVCILLLKLSLIIYLGRGMHTYTNTLTRTHTHTHIYVSIYTQNVIVRMSMFAIFIIIMTFRG